MKTKEAPCTSYVSEGNTCLMGHVAHHYGNCQHCNKYQARKGFRIFKKDKKRKNCLLGVSYDVKTNKYKSQLNHNGKKISLGYFNNKIEAFYAYKNAKENYIKQVADEYKDKIPKKLYNAMYKWEIGVND